LTRSEPPRDTIIQRAMEDVMHQSMIPYSEYVILERALPRVEDGLKPVQRRILFTMHELGLSSDKPHRKCARIVGDCLGKYHPHGDTSVYDALARMAQPFVMRGLLVDGHGNFGSIDGDSPAAMRYTEAKMTSLAMELLRDIDKDTVGFHLNFDDTQKEPDMLPGRFPNLLVNGASGIAVGLATNIPPHNLGEAIDGVIAQIDKPEITVGELMRFIPAPDFPTGGILLKDGELKQAYETGRGKLQVRAKVHVEPGPSGRSLLVVTEMPYQVGKSSMLEKILKLSEEKKALFSGIHDIRDESDRTGMRAVIELKRDVDPEKTLALLYKYSDLQVTFGVNIVAIAGGKPVQMGLKDLIAHFIRHQKDVVTRRTKYELEQAKARAHILEGLIIAVDNLDEVIRLIRASSTPKEAREKLMARFGLTEIQAQAILDMRLQRLTNLEIVTLRKEYEEIKKLIDRLTGILNSEKKLLALIKQELSEIRAKYADPRRTALQDRPDEPQVFEEEKPVAEEAVVIVTRAGFVKRLTPKAWEKAQAEDAEKPRFAIRAMTDERILFFSNLGQCYPVPVPQVPEVRPKDRGLALTGLLAGFEAKEKLIAAFALADDGYAGDLIFATRGGLVKRSTLSEYAVRKARFAAINLKSGDELMYVERTAGDAQMLLVTERAMSILFDAAEIPSTGRATAGVKGITLAPDDRVAFAFLADSQDGEALLVSDRGYMKRCLMVDFDPQARGGKGVKCFQFLKNGTNGEKIAGALLVKEPFEFVALQHQGQATKLNTEWVKIELKAGKGQPLVMAMLDDLVEEVYPA
jgi:DNA gyrase subunit A